MTHTAVPTPSALPSIIPLDGDWAFTYTYEPGEGPQPVPPAADAFSCRMPVPAYWDDHLDNLRIAAFWSDARFNPDYRHIEFPLGQNPPDASLPYLLGVGWYRREFVAPPAGRVTLAVGGVALEAWVWLNGAFVGHHLGHSTPFEMSLDAPLRHGETNKLLIAVANTRTDRTGCAIRGYKGRSAGITRSVSLRVSGHSRIVSHLVYPSQDLTSLHWRADLDGPLDAAGMTLSWTVREQDTGVVMGEGTVPAQAGRMEWTSDPCGMKPWSDRSPRLYDVTLALHDQDQHLDTRSWRFGLRRLVRKDMSLYLNGQPSYLRGVTEHAYYPLSCTVPTDIHFYRTIIRQFKKIGYNWLRFHTWVPPQEYMDAADELGIMIQVEAPKGFQEQEWVDILHACRNHPSVILYCGGNEEVLDEDKIEQLRRMATLCRELTPDALFNPQSALRGAEYYWAPEDMGEDWVEEPYVMNHRRMALLKEFSDAFGHAPRGAPLSYRSVGGDWRVIDDRLKVYERPCLGHELGIHDNCLNLDLEHRYEGTRIGTELFAAQRRSLQRAGLLHRASLYYHNSCQWMRILRKHVVEIGRKCRRLTGYDFLGAIDTHWHRCGYPCGVMNEFYELKPGESVADVLAYNGESVLLLDHSNQRNLNFGNPFSLEVLVSLFSPEPLDAGTLSWTLEDSAGVVHLRSERPLWGIPTGCVTSLGNIAFDVPQLERPDRLRLRTRLSGGALEITNSWNFWAFPQAAAPPLAADADDAIRSQFGARYPALHPVDESQAGELRVVRELDADTTRWLIGGGRVLLLGGDPFPTLPTRFQMSISGRPQGHIATCIEDHWITRRFPHEGYCDWQFYTMLDQGSAVVFNDAPMPFDPIIEIVSPFKQVQKQAVLFELSVGRGQLLVCTFDLDLADPAGVYLLDTLLAYAQSASFHPHTWVDAPAFVRWVGRDQEWTGTLETDQGFDQRGQLPPAS